MLDPITLSLLLNLTANCNTNLFTSIQLNQLSDGMVKSNVLKTSHANNTIAGLESHDIIVGKSGGNVLFGNDSQNILQGGRRNNTFNCGSDSNISLSCHENGFRVGYSDDVFLVSGKGDAHFKRGSGRKRFFGKSGNLSGNAQLANALQQTINQGLQQANVPGAALAVSTPDGTTWVGSGGFSNLDTKTSMRPDDRFGIASITKPIVATTVLQLVEEQKLNLEDTLSDWLPDIASHISNGDRITLRQLLNMTSGIPDYSRVIEEATINEPSILQRQWTSLELVSLIDNQPALFEPGQQFDYSNTNYLLLGEIVEKVTGSTLANQMRERIFKPLGMNNTFYAPQEGMPAGTVRSYFDFDSDGQLDDTNEKLSAGAGAGGIVSTAADVARFAQGLFKGELLAPDTLQQMLSDGMKIDSFTYGLGVFSGTTPNGDRFWAHDGSSFGWSAWMLYLPDRDTTVVALTNRGPTEEDVNNNPLASPESNPVIARLAGPALPLAFQAIETIARQYSSQEL